MPTLIISSYDGVTKVAPIEPTEDMLADAEVFDSMGEALQAVGEVLAEPEGAAEPGDNAQEEAAEGPMSTEGQPMSQDTLPDDDEDMQAGYASAKRGL